MISLKEHLIKKNLKKFKPLNIWHESDGHNLTEGMYICTTWNDDKNKCFGKLAKDFYKNSERWLCDFIVDSSDYILIKATIGNQSKLVELDEHDIDMLQQINEYITEQNLMEEYQTEQYKYDTNHIIGYIKNRKPKFAK